MGKFIARVQHPESEPDVVYFGVMHKEYTILGDLNYYCSSGYRMTNPYGLSHTVEGHLEHGENEDQEMLCYVKNYDQWVTSMDEEWNVTRLIPLDFVTGEGYD